MTPLRRLVRRIRRRWRRRPGGAARRAVGVIAAGLVAAVLAFFAVLALALGAGGGPARGRPGQGELARHGDAAGLRRRGRGRGPGARRAQRAAHHAGGTLGADDRRRRAGALLEPWLGSGLAIDSLPLPLMIEVATDRDALERDELVLRLAAEAPGAVFDDHAAWRAAAGRHRRAAADLRPGVPRADRAGAGARCWPRRRTPRSRPTARRSQTLRLVGARDGFIARRLHPALHAARRWGRCVGTAVGLVLLALLPQASEAGVLPRRRRPAAAGTGCRRSRCRRRRPAIAWAATRQATRGGLRRWS